jgi:O-antigen ligase
VKKPRGPGRRPSPPPPARAPLARRLGTFAVGLVLLVPPFLMSPQAKESFRLPKLLASEWLVLLSLLFLAWELRGAGEVRPADLWRPAALRAVLPILAVATLGLAWTAHPLHVRSALADLWIGAACLAGWSLALSAERLERLLALLLAPAALLALLGILQFHGVFQPLALLGVPEGSRLAVTSTAGNPGDLGSYLVLPLLVAQWLLARGQPLAGRGRWPLGAVAAALAVCAYGLAVTQTLSALAAAFAGSALFWLLRLPRRRALAALGGAAALALVLGLAVTPLRERVVRAAQVVQAGEWNRLLTGRLDGWRTAAHMLAERPWTGVGHGAYRPEFVPAKLALLDRGVEFFSAPGQTVFANAHNELLEAGAEWGVPGLLALGWGLFVLLGGLRRLPAGDRAFAAGGVAALAALALFQFPFRVALVAFPALLFVAWVLRREDDAALSTGEPAA